MRMLIEKSRLFCYTLMVLGAAVQGVGVSLFLEPYGIAPGGVMGISIMISKFIPVGTGTIMILINLPLLAVSYKFLGRTFFARTLFSTLLCSAFIDFFSRFSPASDDKILCSVAGGALIAVSLGIIFQAGGSTGGMDIIVRFLRNAFPQLKSGTLFLILDGFICLISAVVFRNINNALYALVALAVCSRLLDFLLYGADEARLVFIFSKKSDDIMHRLLIKTNSGASFLSGEGGFTGEKTKIIMCAIKKSRYNKLEKIVKETDNNAFMIVTSANEIFGKGFKNYSELLL